MKLIDTVAGGKLLHFIIVNLLYYPFFFWSILYFILLYLLNVLIVVILNSFSWLTIFCKLFFKITVTLNEVNLCILVKIAMSFFYYLDLLIIFIKILTLNLPPGWFCARSSNSIKNTNFSLFKILCKRLIDICHRSRFPN